MYFPILTYPLSSHNLSLLQGVKMKGTCSKLKTWVFENLLLILTFSGVVTGVLGGLALRYYDLAPLTISIIAYPGELFMRLLKLMILPLVIASLITGKKSRFVQI